MKQEKLQFPLPTNKAEIDTYKYGSRRALTSKRGLKRLEKLRELNLFHCFQYIVAADRLPLRLLADVVRTALSNKLPIFIQEDSEFTEQYLLFS